MSDITFTLIQSTLHWEDANANRLMFEEKIKKIQGHKEVVLLPETFSTGFSMNPKKLSERIDGETLQWMKRITKENKIILGGSIIIEEDNHFYNRFIWMQPNGEYGVYNKRHLFSFAGEDVEFTKGEKRFIAQVKGWKICTQICYDLRFPIWNRQQKEHEYDVLVFVANWPERRITAWKSLLQARAIENQCYVMAVNRVGSDGNGVVYNGCSSVISPLGHILYSKENDEDVFSITLQKNYLEETRTQFPFQKDKDDFMIL